MEITLREDHNFNWRTKTISEPPKRPTNKGLFMHKSSKEFMFASFIRISIFR